MAVAISSQKDTGNPGSQHLFSPFADFMMLGGSSLLLLPLLVVLPQSTFKQSFVVGAFLLSFVINYPHFAVSYRIFYQDYARKISAVGSADATLRYRYLFAGIAAPSILTGVLLYPMFANDPRALGYMYHLMIFSVGWHYVKQGYGMAMVDAAFKKLFFDNSEKKILRANGYAVWVTSWLMGMDRFGGRDYFDIAVPTIPVSGVLLPTSVGILVVSSAATAVVLGRRLLLPRATAWTGVVAYLVSLYAWLLLIRASPLFLLLTPALHSLQYLYVVKRFQLNRHSADDKQNSWKSQYWKSVGIGALMFLFIPTALDKLIPLGDDGFGGLPFTFASLIFINVHHYFLDNVMWRRGNPEVSKHLFARAA